MSSTHLTTPRHQLQPVLGRIFSILRTTPFGDERDCDRKTIQVPLYRFSIDVSWQTSLEVEHGWSNRCLHDCLRPPLIDPAYLSHPLGLERTEDALRTPPISSRVPAHERMFTRKEDGDGDGD